MTISESMSSPSGATEAQQVQIFSVGLGAEERDRLAAVLGPRLCDHQALQEEDWASTAWQTRRRPCGVWAILALPAETTMDMQDTLRWIQMLGVVLRPARLLILAPALGLEQTISLVRAGADGILPRTSSAQDIAAHLSRGGLRRSDLFPVQGAELAFLKRVGEELHQGRSDLDAVLARLIRLCVNLLNADRGTLFLCPVDGHDGHEHQHLFLAAGFGLPPGLQVGAPVVPRPGSVLDWVATNKKPLLLQGPQQRDTARISETSVGTAVSAPMMDRDRLLGIVNISRTRSNSAEFGPQDLTLVEVFTALASFAVTNQRLNERKLQEERLAQVGRTTADISHCVKNILQVLTSGINIATVDMEKGKLEEAKLGLDLAARSAQRLQGLMLDLLDFAKERQPDLSPCSPATILREVVEGFQFHSARPSLSIHVNMDQSAEGDVLLDGPRLHRALMNLLGNAIEAQPNGGQVTVSCHRDKDTLRIRVEDEGPGVEEENLEAIFSPFFSTKGSKGTGLGLPMVSKFARESGGSVLAANRPDGGLAVTLTLPAVKPSA